MLRSTVMTFVLTAGFGTIAAAETMQFHATMDGAHEVPPKQSSGTGTANATLDTATKELNYTVDWSGLTGPATAAHFHGPADPGVNAGIVVPIDGKNPTSPAKGSATLTDAQMKDLEDGKWYVNVHTAENPGGEIRGQVVKGK
ncbi:MAG: CHRD domain-containing protein [Acetobacteraceae bacterium]|nr:CHRD domain-containing protein [Acetobacteraceae bacterium]